MHPAIPCSSSRQRERHKLRPSSALPELPSSSRRSSAMSRDFKENFFEEKKDFKETSFEEKKDFKEKEEVLTLTRQSALSAGTATRSRTRTFMLKLGLRLNRRYRLESWGPLES